MSGSLLDRLAAALAAGGPLPLGLVELWRVHGAEAWRRAAYDPLLRVEYVQRGWRTVGRAETALREHWQQHSRRHGRCCADVVRAVVEMPTTDELAQWGRAVEERR